MDRVRLATVWLDGCSGCHMSLLDIDERLLAIADRIDLVYGPLMDAKTYPEGVDVALIEGAVSSEDDEAKLRTVRANTQIVVALGDCAVNSNVPSMRNQYRRIDILHRAYHENASIPGPSPNEVVPPLRPKAVALHDIVKVDLFLPGCPPHADKIFDLIDRMLNGEEGREPLLARFG